ncbi:MAG: hypothetical protein KIS72_09340, partial [Luteimonas sp.]|nr:hypothetical protein [Luteimonas sp.]
RAACRAVGDIVMAAKLTPVRSIPFALAAFAVMITLSWYFVGLAEAQSIFWKGIGVAAAIAITSFLAFFVALLCAPHRLDAEKQSAIDSLEARLASDADLQAVCDEIGKLVQESKPLNRTISSLEDQAQWCEEYWQWHSRVCAYLSTLMLADLNYYEIPADNRSVRLFGRVDPELHERNVRYALASAVRLQEIGERYRPSRATI